MKNFILNAKQARECSDELTTSELYELKRIENEIWRCIRNRLTTTKIYVSSDNILNHLIKNGYKMERIKDDYFTISW